MSDLDNIEKLKRLSKGDGGFKSPHEGYFQTFEDRIEARIKQEEEPKKPLGAQVIQLLKPVLALAACFIFVMLIIRYPTKMVSDYANNDTEITEAERYRIESDMLEDSYLAEMIIASDAEFTGATEEVDDDVISELAKNMSDYDMLLALENE